VFLHRSLLVLVKPQHTPNFSTRQVGKLRVSNPQASKHDEDPSYSS
jgi:hypothetical protein